MHALRGVSSVLDLKDVFAAPSVADLGLAPDAEAGRAVGAVEDVRVLLGAVVPEGRHAVQAAIELDLDLLVALADRGRFELGNALLEIGATIAAKIRRNGRPKTKQHRHSDERGYDRQARRA